MSNINDFKKEYDKATKVILNACEKTVRGTAINIFSAVIRATPVGNTSLWKTKYPPKNYRGGRLRGNWQSTLRKPADGTLETHDTSGGETISKAVATAQAFKLLDKSLYLTNNLPYAEPIENGHSTQIRPGGMVAASVAGFTSVVEKISRENKV